MDKTIARMCTSVAPFTVTNVRTNCKSAYCKKTFFGQKNSRTEFDWLKFIHSEKATKFCEIFTLILSYIVPVKSKVKILQNFVAFLEYMNFTWNYRTFLRLLFPNLFYQRNTQGNLRHNKSWRRLKVRVSEDKEVLGTFLIQFSIVLS